MREEEELDEAEVNKRVEKRLRDLIVLALNKSAPEEEATAEDENGNEKAISDAINALPEEGLS